ncbi:hypothetical protein ACVIGB_002528 [Bradyrhizobium sp. USDA 4341]
MAKTKLPERVDDGARPESRKKPKVEREGLSDLVEIAKQAAEYRKNFGKWWGGLLLLFTISAASRRRPFLWSGLFALGTVGVGLMTRYVVPLIAG